MTAAKVTGSVAVTPYNNETISLVIASAPAIPIAIPVSNKRAPLLRISRNTFAGGAPKAIRRPISLVRRRTR
jgi:hypothetical protein